MRDFHRRIGSAHVLGFIALFVALGGTVYAAKAISGRVILKGSIPGNRIRENDLTGTQINEATLGRVPSAANADTANTARSADTANTARSADTANTARSAESATTANTATSAKTADNAAALGGVPASGYLRPCAPGLPQGIAELDTTGLTNLSSTEFVGIPAAFNCGGGQVEAARIAAGLYEFVFNGLPSRPNEPVIVTLGNTGLSTLAQASTTSNLPGKRIVRVRVFGTAVGAADNQTINLVLY